MIQNHFNVTLFFEICSKQKMIFFTHFWKLCFIYQQHKMFTWARHHTPVDDQLSQGFKEIIPGVTEFRMEETPNLVIGDAELSKRQNDLNVSTCYLCKYFCIKKRMTSPLSILQRQASSTISRDNIK